MARFETLDTLPALKGQAGGTRVLVRGDLNVPRRDGVVTEATRIERLAPTIIELADRGCKVIVMSHFDRPKGRFIPEMSLKPLVQPLKEALGGRDVVFVEDCIDAVLKLAITSKAANDVFNIGSGEIVSISDIAQQAINVSGRPNVEYTDLEENINYSPTAIMADITKVTNTIDWWPQVTLSEGLKKMWDGYLER